MELSLPTQFRPLHPSVTNARDIHLLLLVLSHVLQEPWRRIQTVIEQRLLNHVVPARHHLGVPRLANRIGLWQDVAGGGRLSDVQNEAESEK